MRQTPTKEELLAAVADFLETDLRAALTDKALAFRARIAANLLRSVALESAGEDRADRDELATFLAEIGAERELERVTRFRE